MPPRRVHPPNTLEECLDLPKKIIDENAGNPMKRIFLADAIGRKPSSSAYKALLSSSRRYGLTEGTEKAEFISITSLGQQIIRSKGSDRMKNLQKACMLPEKFNQVYSYYKDSKVPSEDVLKKVLVDQFKVPSEWVDEFLTILITNGKFTQLIQNVAGSDYIVFDKYQAQSEETSGEHVEEEEPYEEDIEDTHDTDSQPVQEKEENKLIFVAHGKNKTPLDQLKNVLNKFKIEHRVAVDEPHGGRPISQKVSELMHECSSAILIFTADEEYHDSEGNIHYRPSDNVVYELGAATVLYGNRIVIFKEEDVTFASNFQDFGYITFEKDKLNAKSMELLMELVELGFVKITPT